MANGYNWQYKHIPDGVRITSGVPVDGTFPTTLTVPGTLGGSPVLEVRCMSIKGDISIEEVVFPSSLRWFDLGDGMPLFDFSFFADYSDGIKERTEPLTERFTGPAIPPGLWTDCAWDISLEQIAYPEDGEFKQSWEEMLKWQSFHIEKYANGGGGAVWDYVAVPQYKPNLDDRAEEIKETLLAKYGADANAKAAVDALATLFELNSESGVRSALKKFGITVDNGVWTWDEEDYNETDFYQPNDGVKVLTSSSVQKKITSAIASLAKIPTTWGGMRLTDEDFPFIDGAICLHRRGDLLRRGGRAAAEGHPRGRQRHLLAGQDLQPPRGLQESAGISR